MVYRMKWLEKENGNYFVDRRNQGLIDWCLKHHLLNVFLLSGK